LIAQINFVFALSVCINAVRFLCPMVVTFSVTQIPVSRQHGKSHGSKVSNAIGSLSTTKDKSVTLILMKSILHFTIILKWILKVT